MTSKFALTAALSLLCTVSPAFAADSAFASESDGRRVTVETTSAGTVGHCKAQVSRSLKICDANDDCKRSSLGDEASFVVPRGGSFAVTASVSYLKDGVIFGDAVVDRFERIEDGERLVQTVKTGERCSQVFSYEFHAR